jgi:hypothetical protein
LASPFEFQLNLTGQFASALAPVNKGLAETMRGLGGVRQDVRAFEAQLGGLKSSSLGASFEGLKGAGSFFTFDLAKGAELAVEAVVAVTKAVLDLGKEIIRTAAEAQDLNLAVRLDVGEKGAADVQALADSFASNTRLDDDFVKESLLPLLEQGVGDTKLLDDLVTASSDVAARRKSGQAGAQAALGAFQRIALKGEVDSRALRELAVGEAAFFEDLGSLLGVSSERAQKLAKAGKVKSETLLSVALNQVAQREGGALGIASLESGKTLGATLDRLGNLQGNLLKQLADSPGVKAVQSVLDNLIAVLTGPLGSAAVAQLGDVFGGLVTTIFGSLSGEDGLKRLERGLKVVLDAVGQVVGFVQSNWPIVVRGFEAVSPILDTIGIVLGGVIDVLGVFGAIAKAAIVGLALPALERMSLFVSSILNPALRILGNLFGNYIRPAIEYVAEAIGKLLARLNQTPDFIRRFFAFEKEGLSIVANATGKDAGQGLAQGLRDTQLDVSEASRLLAQEAPKAIVSELEVRSPSRVLRELGGHGGEGFALGLGDTAPDVRQAARRALGDTTQAEAIRGSGAVTPGGAAGAAGASLSIGTIEVTVHTGGRDGQAIGQAAAQGIRFELVRLLRDIGVEVGAEGAA